MVSQGRLALARASDSVVSLKRMMVDSFAVVLATGHPTGARDTFQRTALVPRRSVNYFTL
jgi:hypothetical protein